MGEPALRLVECPDCERLRRALDAALAENEVIKADLDQKRRMLRTRRKEERKALAEAALREQAEPLFAYWQEQCDHPRAKFGPAVQKALYGALELGFTQREIAEAIKGAAVAAWVDERGKRHDGLPLICRDEEKLRDFIERYERWKEQG